MGFMGFYLARGSYARVRTHNMLHSILLKEFMFASQLNTHTEGYVTDVVAIVKTPTLTLITTLCKHTDLGKTLPHSSNSSSEFNSPTFDFYCNSFSQFTIEYIQLCLPFNVISFTLCACVCVCARGVSLSSLVSTV